MVFVLTLTMLATSLAGGVALSSLVERQISSAYRRSMLAEYAAAAAAERVCAFLEASPDWRALSAVVPAGDTEAAPEVIERTAALNRSLSARFPLGPDTPRWWLVFAGDDSGHQVSVWLADDPADRDGRADEDSNGRLMVRAEAWGRPGTVRVVEVHLERKNEATRYLSWREVW